MSPRETFCPIRFAILLVTAGKIIADGKKGVFGRALFMVLSISFVKRPVVNRWRFSPRLWKISRPKARRAGGAGQVPMSSERRQTSGSR